MTSTAWSPEQLEAIGRAPELEIATRRADGTLRGWVPIWVVCVDDGVYVRTWYRRETGWFGHALGSRRARVRVPGAQADVTVEDVGTDRPDLRGEVDAAYRAKYGQAGATGGMVTDEAAASTLRLVADPAAP